MGFTSLTTLQEIWLLLKLSKWVRICGSTWPTMGL